MVQSSIKAQLYEDLLRHVDFTLRDEITGATLPLKPSVRKYLEKWLLQRASCRLHPAWTDLGALFWPRWVRRGSCGQESTDVRPSQRRRRGRRRPAPSCSWPPGMRCVPEASQTVRLLRWHCGAAAARRRRADQDPQGNTAEGAVGRRRSKSGRRRRGRGRRPRVRETKYGDGVGPGPAWQWRCRWKKVPYAVTTACFCSC